MTEKDLRQALSISLDHENAPKKGIHVDIPTLTAELVSFNSNDGNLRAHKSLVDHLLKDKVREREFLSIREHIPNILMHFLSLKYMKTDVSSISKDEFLKIYPLCSYALEF